MKRLLFISAALLVGILNYAQDFSYLKTIDFEDESQVKEAEEAALECCCYLTGVRYNKKDSQRQQATAYVKNWLQVNCSDNYQLDGLWDEESEQADVYEVFYALNYLHNDRQAGLKGLQAEALTEMVAYCSNSANKLKMTKELKEVAKRIEAGQLDSYLANLRLTTLAE